jgi:hypothetical protein
MDIINTRSRLWKQQYTSTSTRVWPKTARVRVLHVAAASLIKSRPLISNIPAADDNFGTNRFRPLFPKSVHKRSINSRVYSISCTHLILHLCRFADKVSVAFCPKLNTFESGLQILVKTKFHENPSSGGQVVSCERTDGQTDRKTERDGGTEKRNKANSCLSKI